MLTIRTLSIAAIDKSILLRYDTILIGTLSKILPCSRFLTRCAKVGFSFRKPSQKFTTGFYFAVYLRPAMISNFCLYIMVFAGRPESEKKLKITQRPCPYFFIYYIGSLLFPDFLLKITQPPRLFF